MISEKRLLLTEDGDVVEDGDPTGEYLLVGKGCAINDTIARRYGLLPAPEGEDALHPTFISAGNVAGLVPQSSGDPLGDLLAAKLTENILKNQSIPAPTSQDLGVTQAEAEDGAAITTAPAEVSVPADAEAEAVTVVGIQSQDTNSQDTNSQDAQGTKAITSTDAENKAVTTASDKAVKSGETK